MLQLNRQFVEDGLELDPDPPEDVLKLLKTFNEVINAAERAKNENHWDKLFAQYSQEIQTLLNFVEMLATATNAKKGTKIKHMKKILHKKSHSIENFDRQDKSEFK